MFNLFKRKRLPKIEFPYEYIIVPGDKAIETCLKIRNDKTKNESPVILGDDVNFLLENYSLSDTPPDVIISSANHFNVNDFIKNMDVEV